jgi:asparagine synthase (glutamine-hydrolysing)
VSGIVGIVNHDGAPVDPALLRRLTESLSFRGPDALNCWTEGNVGFGHTMLRTTDEAEHEVQPCTIDGNEWITADARVDGREDLLRELRGKGENPRKAVTDPELILHAYRAWGEDCVNHLLGDFAFAIWDGRRKNLFCARDHMGVKQFYYSVIGAGFFFSNTLNCLRSVPGVSSRLNEVAIGDFLVFGYKQDTATTTFADIQQIPPGHCLSASGQRFDITRHWTFPLPGELSYKRSEDYVEHFLDLLRNATRDRIRSNRVSISMSGGLDSPALALLAKEVVAGRGGDGLLAITVVRDRLSRDRERYFAGLVADHLGIPIEFLAADDNEVFRRWGSPEPIDNPLHAMQRDLLATAARHSRVLLSGDDADGLLHPSRRAYVRALISKRSFGRLFRDAAWFLITQRRIPKLPIRSRRDLRTASRDRDLFLSLVNPDFERRVRLRERVAELSWPPIPPSYSTRATTFRMLTSPSWNERLATADPGATLVNVETRYPFLDIRLIRFCLMLPQVPWCVGKHIIRASVQGRLPPEIVRRPKTPFGILPLPLGPDYLRLAEEFRSNPKVMVYMADYPLPVVDAKSHQVVDWQCLRVLALGHWLQSITALR